MWTASVLSCYGHYFLWSDCDHYNLGCKCLKFGRDSSEGAFNELLAYTCAAPPLSDNCCLQPFYIGRVQFSLFLLRTFIECFSPEPKIIVYGPWLPLEVIWAGDLISGVTLLDHENILSLPTWPTHCSSSIPVAGCHSYTVADTALLLTVIPLFFWKTHCC